MQMYDTIEFKKTYKSLNDTLYWIVQQAKISVPYCINVLKAKNDTAKDIWYKMKPKLIYERDTPGIEQIQSVGTLFENNIHGIPGAGDCDCFTTLTIAMLLASGENPNDINIYLQGNKKKYPSHILTEFKGIYIDFTQPMYNTKRNYNYFDVVTIKKYL